MKIGTEFGVECTVFWKDHERVRFYLIGITQQNNWQVTVLEEDVIPVSFPIRRNVEEEAHIVEFTANAADRRALFYWSGRACDLKRNRRRWRNIIWKRGGQLDQNSGPKSFVRLYVGPVWRLCLRKLGSKRLICNLVTETRKDIIHWWSEKFLAIWIMYRKQIGNALTIYAI